MQWRIVKSSFFHPFPSGFPMVAVSFYVVIIKKNRSKQSGDARREASYITAPPARVHCRTPDILRELSRRHSAGGSWWKRPGCEPTRSSNKRRGCRLVQESGFRDDLHNHPLLKIPRRVDGGDGCADKMGLERQSKLGNWKSFAVTLIVSVK